MLTLLVAAHEQGREMQDQAVRVNYLWPSLSAKTQKSCLHPFSLVFFLTQMEETCIGEHEGGVRREEHSQRS